MEYRDMSIKTLRESFANDRKTMITAGYRETVRSMLTELAGDTIAIEKLVFQVINEDYAPADCKDNKALQTAYRTLCKTLQDIPKESEFVELYNGVLIIAPSKPTDGVRGLSVSLKSEKQIAVEAERAEHDKAEKAARAEQDKQLAEEQRQAEISRMTDLDVFLRVRQYIADTYGDNRDIRAVMAAGLAWIDKQAEQQKGKQVAAAKKAAAA